MRRSIAFREFWRRPRQVGLYLVSVVICFGAFLVIDSLQVSLDRALASEQKNLVGGDIILDSNQPFDAATTTALEAIKPDTTQVEIYEFSSMVRSETSALLASVKIVSDAYPLYGTVALASGKDLSTQLLPGQVVVDPALLVSLAVRVGDQIFLGDQTLTIADTITLLPDQSLSFGGFGGPTILVNTADIETLGLLGDKSRVTYKRLIKTTSPTIQSDALAQLKPLIKTPVTIESAETAQTPIRRFTDRFLVFVKIIIISLLLLNIMAMATIIVSFLTSQQTIIAIRKSLGESTISIQQSYHLTFMMWSSIGFLIMVGLSGATLGVIHAYGADFFPIAITIQLSLLSVIKTFGLLIGTTFLLTFFGLAPVTKMTPAALLRFESVSVRALSRWLTGAALLVLYGLFIYVEFESVPTTILFCISVLMLFGLFFGIIKLVLWIMKQRINTASFYYRIIIRSLSRPGSSSPLFLSILTLSLTFIFGIILLEQTLQRQFFAPTAESAPNIFLLDIKQDQVAGIQDFFAEEILFYPVIRGRINRVNAVPIATFAEQKQGFGDNISRVFNLTYYDAILPSEKLISSVKPQKLFDPTLEDGITSVSILESLAEDFDLQLGDTIVFTIQGIEIPALVTSIRSRNSRTEVSPFFYFVFPTEILKPVPQTLFATTNIDADSFALTQKKLLDLFPQVSILDTSQIRDQVANIIAQLSIIIRWFTVLNILVGLVVLISSLVATTKNRQEEAAFYRLQGMTKRNIWELLIIEMSCVAILIITISLLLSYLSVGLMLAYFFDIQVVLFPLSMIGYSAAMFGCVVLSAVAVLYQPLQIQPIDFIRRYS